MGERVSRRPPSSVPSADCRYRDGESMDQLVLPEVAAGRTIQAVHILCLSVEVKMLFMSVGLSGDWGLGCVSCTGYMYANR